MSLARYSLICVFCGLIITVTGCTKEPVQVVNTNSGILIRSSDYINPTTQKTTSTKVRYEQVSAPTNKSTGTVIRLGDGYENIELNPVFNL